jgi:hypothetical protein
MPARLAITAAIVCGALGCGGCSQKGDALPQLDGGLDASADAAVEAAWDAASEAGPPCTPVPRPSYVPGGWVPYDDYAPCSGLYIPTDPSQLPAPITWQPCEATAGVAGCRRINLDWGPLPSQPGTDADAALDANGNVVLLTSRPYGDADGGLTVHHVLSLIAAPDGPVYTALLATQPKTYRPYVFVPPTFAPPRWILLVLENDAFNTSGYIAGTLGNLRPTAHGRLPGNYSAVVGDLGVLGIGSNAFVTLFDFDAGVSLLDIKTPSLPMSFEWMFRSSVFWQGNSGYVDDVGRWDADAGAMDFINYGFDPNHGAMALGTDGTDMVWLQVHGMNPDAGPYVPATVDYWTSPYVTSSQTLQPRRLRSETPPASVGSPITVGCGRASYATPAGLRIVRLSDGWSWFIPDAGGWNWQQTLALTCNELFVRVRTAGPITTMARVAFNQLGPGIAPD